MSKPYKVSEFAATSGNKARLKVYALTENRAIPVDVSWDVAPSEADIAECNAWFIATGPVRGATHFLSMKCDNQDQADELIAAMGPPSVPPSEAN